MSRRDELEARRDAVRERVAKRRAGKKPERRRPWAWIVLTLFLLLLLLLQDCSCGPGDAPDSDTDVCECEAEEAEPEEVPPPPLTGRIKRQDRPEYKTAKPATLNWLDEFRMQVAARSPRLAKCFVGVQQPGQLKWSTSVEPDKGRVSAHSLEPMLQTIPLNREEKACVLGVLEDPPYKLETGDEPATPSRVGLVLEF